MKDEIIVDGEKYVKKSVFKEIKRLGFKPLGLNKPNANGPDLFVIKGTKAYSMEIKSIRKTKRDSIQVNPVERNRQNDDLIAIVFPSGYVLIEPMVDHMKSCTPKGYRTLTLLG